MNVLTTKERENDPVYHQPKQHAVMHSSSNIASSCFRVLLIIMSGLALPSARRLPQLRLDCLQSAPSGPSDIDRSLAETVIEIKRGGHQTVTLRRYCHHGLMHLRCPKRARGSFLISEI